MNERTPEERWEGAIAIVGMAGRFPGARNLREFWANLQGGVESIHAISDEELMEAGVSESLIHNERYVKATTVLENVDKFDAGFFGYTPREAELLDPQHRLFLECAWESMEHAGYNPCRYPGQVGVYAGAGMSHYFMSLCGNQELRRSGELYSSLFGNEKDFLATRVSYKLNLQGPSMAVQTSCSSSLVAVHLACQSLLTYQCDAALAGGVATANPHKVGYVHEKGMIFSSDGHCRAFDARADGTVAGKGVGVVLLKRMDDALSQNDRIYAVIKGSAINNDGSLKVSYMAPSVTGQADVIAEALENAEVPPETISYIETHGTGTSLGDPAEIAGLVKAFGDVQKRQFCALGSVKTNIGHLDAAAGMAGLIKTVLALQHEQIPPSLHFEHPNPQIDFAASPFYVNAQLSPWPTGATPRRAGISCFGVGGTNAHVLLEEAPPRQASSPSRPIQPLLISARSMAALEESSLQLAEHFKQLPEESFADAAYTQCTGRRSFEYRRMLLARSAGQAAEILQDPSSLHSTHVEEEECPVAFLFSGQGAQHPAMAVGLLETEAVFRREMEASAEIIRAHEGWDLLELIQADSNDPSLAVHLSQTRYVQPLLFAVSHSLARLWENWGVVPAGMLGHSVGEYVAASLGGLMSHEDALKLVLLRGKLMQTMPEGAMSAVALGEDALPGHLAPWGDQLSLAAVNGPEASVVSGPTDLVEEFEKAIEDRKIPCRRLGVSHAFHSAMMDPILESFREAVAKTPFSEPDRTWISNLSGTWISKQEVIRPEYWVSHLRRTVKYSQGIQELLKSGIKVFLEVGPGRMFSQLAQAHFASSQQPLALTSLPSRQESIQDQEHIIRCAGHLWSHGVTMDWDKFYECEERRREALPTYPFERKRYWINQDAAGDNHNSRSSGTEGKKELSDWFYIPAWRPALASHLDVGQTLEGKKMVWLIFRDSLGLADNLTNRLCSLGQKVVTVDAGQAWAKKDEQTFELVPDDPEHYVQLMESLHDSGLLPDMVLHLFGLDADPSHETEVQNFDRCQDLGYFSLQFLARSLGGLDTSTNRRIHVMANDVHAILSENRVRPEKATVLGPCHVIPQEYPNLECRFTDLQRASWDPTLIELLLAETLVEVNHANRLVRDGQKWIPHAEPVRMDSSQPAPGVMRSEGVWVITGGLGGVGLKLAEYLARQARAHLVLLGRQKLPSRDRWGEFEGNVEDPMAGKIQGIQALESAGGKVETYAVDVANPEEMKKVFQDVRQNHGAIHGVIHAAGLPGGGIIQLRKRDQVEQVFSAKIKGALVLDELIHELGLELDAFILVSSLATWLGGVGQVDYCAANAFLDAMGAAHRSRAGNCTQVINWDLWLGTGMARDSTLAELNKRNQGPQGERGMSPDEGMEAFGRLLQHRLSQVLVSTFPLKTATVPMVQSSNSPEEPSPVASSRRWHERPDLMNAFVEPETNLEKVIAGIWKEGLGIREVGLRDNFFELGGHSFLATRILSRLNDTFPVNLDLESIFENPTVSGLAREIKSRESHPGQIDEIAALFQSVEAMSQEEINQAVAGLEDGEESS